MPRALASHAVLQTTGDPLVTLALAKQHARVLGDDEDDVIERLIPAATQRVEDALRHATQVRRHRVTWPDGVQDVFMRLELPRPPLVEVESVEAWSIETDAWTALDADEYVLRDEHTVAAIVPASGHRWPLSTPLRCTYKAGYASMTDAPPGLITAILSVIAWDYQHRGDDPTAPGVAGSVGARPNLRALYPELVIVWP